MMTLQTVAEPHRRARARLVALHLRDGGRGLRALHRARQPRGLGAAADSAGRCVYGSLWALVALLACLYPSCADAPYWAHALRALFQPIDGGLLPVPLAGVRRRCFAVLALPIGALGRAAAAALPPAAPRGGRSRRRRRAALRAGTRSARCSARCSAATCCSSGSTCTTSTGSRSRGLALGALVLTLRVRGAAPGLVDAARAARAASGRARRCCRPGTRAA